MTRRLDNIDRAPTDVRPRPAPAPHPGSTGAPAAATNSRGAGGGFPLPRFLHPARLRRYWYRVAFCPRRPTRNLRGPRAPCSSDVYSSRSSDQCYWPGPDGPCMCGRPRGDQLHRLSPSAAVPDTWGLWCGSLVGSAHTDLSSEWEKWAKSGCRSIFPVKFPGKLDAVSNGLRNFPGNVAAAQPVSREIGCASAAFRAKSPRNVASHP